MENVPFNKQNLNIKASGLKPPCQLSYEEVMEDIRISMEQIDRGETLSHEEVMTMVDELIKNHK